MGAAASSGQRHPLLLLGPRLRLQAERARSADLGRADRGHCTDGAGLDHRLCHRSRPMSGSRSMRTPLARVRNLGSSHSGTKDFWRQRLTAVAMALLIVPVIVIVLMLLRWNQ